MKFRAITQIDPPNPSESYKEPSYRRGNAQARGQLKSCKTAAQMVVFEIITFLPKRLVNVTFTSWPNGIFTQA